jgi:pyruvate formate-lyase activating enzyme-like uncharacterized protein
MTDTTPSAKTRQNKIPADLQAVWAEVARQRAIPSNLREWEVVWQAHLENVKAQVGGVCIEDGGETVYLGAMSPGCSACKEGAWDCIITTGRCNLSCDFCSSPRSIHPDFAGSAFGSTPDELEQKYPWAQIHGLSFNGGEPFLFPDSLLDWVVWAKGKFPGVYCWVYTNGLLLKEDNLRRLGRLGLDEIRINTAATGYTHPVVMDNLATAARCLPTVTVEIPAIPVHARQMLAALGEWAARGAKFLNLHELMLEPGTNAESLNGPRRQIILEDGHRTAVHPQSRLLTLAAMKQVQTDGLSLAVNDCSLQSKIRQLRGRRRNLSLFNQMPYERLLDDDKLESVFVASDSEDGWFCHPDQLDQVRLKYPQERKFHLVRRAPLTINTRPEWISMEEIG